MEWIGRTRDAADVVSASPLAAMSATLGRDDPPPEPGDPLPAGWHWVLFPDTTPTAELDEDGHARRGAFLPPVALPRRMYAGGRLDFHQPLRVGESVRRVSEIAEITPKRGRTGDLVIVVIRHTFFGESGLAIEEEQSLIFREASKPDAPESTPQPAPTDAAFSRAIHPDPVTLFRYSGADLQQPPHPLRPHVLQRPRGISRTGRSRTADREPADGPGAPRAAAGAARILRLPGALATVRHRALHRRRKAKRSRVLAVGGGS